MDNRSYSPHQVPLRRYRRLVWVTVGAVYFLILVGAGVRASGAGMGCPDWPTCFGRWLPPVSESQLPADYQTIYAHLGYAEARFNAVKTWTEYGNRLTGVVIGLLILLTALRSWPCRRYNRRITIASVAALLLVMVQGWLGAMVVGSNLQPGMITVHTLMALLIVATLLYAAMQANHSPLEGESARQGRSPPPSRWGETGLSGHHPPHPPPLNFGLSPLFRLLPLKGGAIGLRLWAGVVLVLVLFQVLLGTQVREMTDFTARAQGEDLRSTWIEAMPWFYYLHRSLSAAVLVLNLYLAWRLWGALGPGHRLSRLSIALLGVVLLAVLSGATLGHLGMPALVQPLHLLAASLLFGLQFILWLGLGHAKQESGARD